MATKSKAKRAIHDCLMKYEDVQEAFAKELPASIARVLELRHSTNERVALEASKESISRAVGPVQQKVEMSAQVSILTQQQIDAMARAEQMGE